MTLVSPIRLSSLLIGCIFRLTAVAQETDSLALVPQLSEPDTIPASVKPELRIYDPNVWRPELSIGVTVAPETGIELSYRILQRDRGVELSAFILPIEVDRKHFFVGTFTNQYLDYKSDTFSLQPYRNITGSWRTIQNSPLPLAPAVVTTAFGGLNLSMPLQFWSKHRLLRVQVAPGVGLYRHSYIRVQDTLLKTTETKVVNLFGDLPYQVRITEYYREAEQYRIMTGHSDYLPFLSYSTLAGFQLTHRLWLEMGGIAAIQFKDYNTIEAPRITRQLSVRFRAGLVYRFRPGPKPIKPVKREVIRI